jgi:hypothetical protein
VNKKTIVFLGGCFQAEISMRASLMENGVKCYYLYENTTTGFLTTDFPTNNYNKEIITFIDNNKLFDYIKKLKPDAIVHRYYKSNPVMHTNAYQLLKPL